MFKSRGAKMSAAAAAAPTRVVARSLAELSAAVSAHAASGRLFVLFSGADGWCPDCELAHPHVEAAVARAAAAAPIVLVEVPLPRAEYSVSANPANSAHWARTHKVFQLKKIPTLVKLNKSGDKKLGELVEGEAADDALLDSLLE